MQPDPLCVEVLLRGDDAPTAGRVDGTANAPGAEAWKNLTDTLWEKDWVVYAKPPFGGPGCVLKYLSRYTHRVAISNRRILSVADGVVRFTWTDYADGQRTKELPLPAEEFLRRFPTFSGGDPGRGSRRDHAHPGALATHRLPSHPAPPADLFVATDSLSGVETP